MKSKCREIVFGLAVSIVICGSAAGGNDWRNKHDMSRPVCGPWLQNASESTMSVSWITYVNCAAGIEYRVKGAKDWTRKWGTRGDKLYYASDLHTFHLKDLAPGTEYEYRLLSSLSRSDSAYIKTYVGKEVYRFRTFDPRRDAYSVFLVSDIHGDFRDLGERVYHRFDVGKCDFVAFLGDQVDDCMNQPRYFIVDGYLDVVSRLWGATKPSVFVRGNHDCWGRHAAEGWTDYHGRPDDVSYYSFSHGPVLYVVLDSPHEYCYKDVIKRSEAAQEVMREFQARQLEWLKALHGSEAWKRATFRVVMNHHAFRLGTQCMGEQRRNQYRPIFNGADGIHLFLCGHEHFTASSLPGEAGYYHDPRYDAKSAKLPEYKASDGSFDFAEVCGDKFGCMTMEVTKERLSIRVGDRKEGAPDLDHLEILPDKTARRIKTANQ